VAQVMTVSVPRCKHCGSNLLVKYGKYKGTQLYYCQACKRKVKGDDNPFHMKLPAEYVDSALDWYFQGLSIHEISDHLSQKYGYHPSTHIVFDWVNKFTMKAVKLFNRYRPEVGTTWIAHETAVHVDKKQKAWLWDIIDARTRFLLATRVSVVRAEHDAQLLLESALREAGKAPETVITGRSSFINANLLAFGANTEYRQGPTLDIRSSAYMIGPCHGKLKDRAKVMRPFKDIHSFRKFNDGFRVYYNFLRPNEELAGQTPAEAAGIEYEIKSWGKLASSPAEWIDTPYHEPPGVEPPPMISERPAPGAAVNCVSQHKNRH